MRKDDGLTIKKMFTSLLGDGWHAFVQWHSQFEVPFFFGLQPFLVEISRSILRRGRFYSSLMIFPEQMHWVNLDLILENRWMFRHTKDYRCCVVRIQDQPSIFWVGTLPVARLLGSIPIVLILKSLSWPEISRFGLFLGEVGPKLGSINLTVGSVLDSN